MAKLDPNPTVATFRKLLSDYITAAKSGERLVLRRYCTPLAEVGPVDDMPKEFRSKAVAVRFTTARNDFPSITRATLQGRAIIITKLSRGMNTEPKKGRKFATTRNENKIAAVWPVPQYAIAAQFGYQFRQMEKKQQKFEDLLTQFVPLLQHFAETKILQAEIDQMRRVAENLRSTIQRAAN
jgi:hypothetical protein